MKIAIITLTASPNFGNFLQNYALQEQLEGYGCEVETIKNYYNSSLFVKKYPLKKKILILLNYHGAGNKELKRKKAVKFYKKYINYSKFKYFGNEKISLQYDKFIVGSDQIWNPNFGVMSSLELLTDVPAEKRFSYSASFGVSDISNISETMLSSIETNLKKFRSLSVREDSGKEIIKNLGIDNVEVHIDPTLLFTAEKWRKLSMKPKKLKVHKFIAVYMLGNITAEYQKKILELSKKYDAEVVNILDENNKIKNPFEFLWIIENAECVCTDSFHATVFSILFNREFYIFDRKDNLKSQNSRFDTLLRIVGINKKKLITETSEIPVFDVDWKLVEKNLEVERAKAEAYLKNLTAST